MASRLTKFFEVKEFADCMPPVSWISLAVFAYTQTIILLHPTLTEFGVLFFIDSILALKLNKKIEGAACKYFNPNSVLFYNGIDESTVASLDLTGRKQLIHNLLEFPLRRALFFSGWSLIKVTPALLIMTFYWHHTISTWSQFSIAFISIALNISFAFGSVFISSYTIVTRRIKELHTKFNFTPVFRAIDISASKTQFFLHEGLTLAAMIFFILFLQVAIINASSDQNALALKVFLVGLLGFCLGAQNWLFGRAVIIKSFHQLINSYSFKNFQQEKESIPLNAIPLIAKFQQTFNQLVERLKLNEQELYAYLNIEVEKSRYQSLGEISGMIAHDLAGPLQVINFSAQELLERPDFSANDAEYIRRIYRNGERMLELVEALRAKLKSDKNQEHHTHFSTAHHRVLSLLQTQYSRREFKSITIDVDEQLQNIPLAIAQVDLIQILDTLYRNGISRLQATPPPNPCIEIKLLESSKNFAKIKINDNGKKLTSARFKELTSLNFAEKSQRNRFDSIGLKLTKRLIEMNRGNLSLTETAAEQTAYILSLPTINPTTRQPQTEQ